MSSLCGALRLTANPPSRGTGWKFGGAKIYGMSRKVSAAEERRISEILARLRERYQQAREASQDAQRGIEGSE